MKYTVSTDATEGGFVPFSARPDIPDAADGLAPSACIREARRLRAPPPIAAQMVDTDRRVQETRQSRSDLRALPFADPGIGGSSSRAETPAAEWLAQGENISTQSGLDNSVLKSFTYNTSVVQRKGLSARRVPQSSTSVSRRFVRGVPAWTAATTEGRAGMRRSSRSGKSRTPGIYLFLTVLLLFGVLPRAVAQQGTGSIFGKIVDSTGAALPASTVTVINQATLRSVVLITDAVGAYQSPPLDSGSYTIQVERDGFTTAAQKDLALSDDQAAEANFTLHPGSVNVAVSVQASAPALNTFNAVLGSVIDNATAESLPLNGSNALAMAQLDPAVISATGPVNEGFNDRGIGVSNIRIGGGVSAANANLLDGAYNLQTTRGDVLINSTVAGIAESRIQYGIVSTQYGLTSGGVITMTTLSGTDQWHGQVYEFFRNDALDASNYFALPGTRPVLRYNQYGIAVGGPIKRDRAFFFTNYEAYGNTQTTPTPITVPTLIERGGDFSDQPLAIYDPTTETACTANSTSGSCRYQYGYTAGLGKGPAGNPVLSGATVNAIPPGEFDSAAAAFQNMFVPQPNVSGALVNNYISNNPLISSQHVGIGRIDWQITSRLSAFVRYAYYDNLTNNEGAYGSLAMVASTRNDDMRNQQLVVGITQPLSPETLNDIRLAVGRSYFPAVAGSAGMNLPAQLGMANVPSVTLPYLSVSNYNLTDSTNQYLRTSTIPEANDTLTLLRGKHSLHIGAGYRFYESYNDANYYPSGEFSFATTVTAQEGTASANTGNAYASFLLGMASSITGTVVAPSTARSFSVNGFVQDDWRALNNLTLNVGLRYDIQAIPWEKHNGFSTLRLNLIDPLNGLQGAEIYASPQHRNFAHENYRDFGPRAGFAWLLSREHHLVLRGGYAIYFAPAFNIVYQNTTDGFGSLTTSYTASTANGDVGQLSAGFPYPSAPLLGAAGGPGLLLGESANVQPVDAPTSMSQQMALSIDHQFSQNTVLDVGLLENRGTHFPMTSINLNQLNPAYYSLGYTFLNGETANPYANDGIPGTLGGKTIQMLQALKPYPYFQDIYQYYPHYGNYVGRMGMLSLVRPLSTTLQMQMGYAFSKLVADPLQTSIAAGPTPTASLQNNYAPHSEYGFDPTDVTHRIAGDLTYKLPFGRDMLLLNHLSKRLDGLVSGFNMSSTLIAETGRPLSITGSNNAGATRPDFVPGVSLKVPHPGPSEWFNTAAFQLAPLYTLGNVPRTLGTLRGPGDISLNLNLSKAVKWERYTGEFRVDAFNVLNRANFETPNTDEPLASTSTTSPSTASTFGTITTAQPARTLQLTAKIRF